MPCSDRDSSPTLPVSTYAAYFPVAVTHRHVVKTENRLDQVPVCRVISIFETANVMDTLKEIVPKLVMGLLPYDAALNGRQQAYESTEYERRGSALNLMLAILVTS